jgi:hypothetical protein
MEEPDFGGGSQGNQVDAGPPRMDDEDIPF